MLQAGTVESELTVECQPVPGFLVFSHCDLFLKSAYPPQELAT